MNSTTIKPMQLRLIFTLFLFSLSGIFAQEMTTIDGKEIPATANWEFLCEDYALSGILGVQIAKTPTGGIMSLTAKVTNSQFYIGGTVYLFLEDNSVITCTDKGIRASKDQNATSFYSFTIAEMSQLKSKAIQNIRFSIKGIASSFSSKTGHFMATNKIKYFGTFDKTIRNTIATEIEINALYQQKLLPKTKN